jgi:hypothetical protein
MAARPWSAAARIVSGPFMYSANRSSKEFMGLLCTRAIAPRADAPSRSKSARRPSPTSTTEAVTGPGVDGASPRDTARSAVWLGETTAAEIETASHCAGTG